MNFSFHPAAEAEHLEQVAWYAARQRAIGAYYHEHFLRTMERVCEGPRQYRVEFAPDIRRARLTPFPLTVLFRERSNGFVEVLAVAHNRRRPGYWVLRASSLK